jgi:hypothetical protein
VTKESTWRRLYQTLPDGRAAISGTQLKGIETADPGRILDTDLRGRSARVLLLDRPYRLGGKLETDGAFVLERLCLRDLPGWPPRLAAPGGDTAPMLVECRLIAARFKRANASGQEGLEFELSHQGMIFTAWLVGCPLPLLYCALKTLNDPGVFGNRMGDVQDIRLVGDGKAA